MKYLDTLIGTTTTVGVTKINHDKKMKLRGDVGEYFTTRRLPGRAAHRLIDLEYDPDPRGRRRWLWLRRGKRIEPEQLDRAWSTLATDPALLRVLAKHDKGGELSKALGSRSTFAPQAVAIALTFVGVIVLSVLPMPISGVLATCALIGAFAIATRSQRRAVVVLDEQTAAIWIPLVRDVAHSRLNPTGRRRAS